MNALTFTFEIDRDNMLSANDREHYRPRARRTAWLRQHGADVVRGAAEAGGPLGPVVDVEVGVQWPDRRRRDTPNVYPTVKALLDGMVDAGLLVDDRDDVVRRTVFEAMPGRCQPGRVLVAVSVVEVDS